MSEIDQSHLLEIVEDLKRQIVTTNTIIKTTSVFENLDGVLVTAGESHILELRESATPARQAKTLRCATRSYVGKNWKGGINFLFSSIQGT